MLTYCFVAFASFSLWMGCPFGFCSSLLAFVNDTIYCVFVIR